LQELSKSKQRETVDIPEGWEFCPLIEFVESKNDIVAGPFGSNLKVSDYRTDGLPLIRLQNIERNKFIDENIRYISREKAEELSYHSYRRNDIVLAKLGDPIGKTCMIPEKIKDGIVVADVVRIRPSLKKTNTKFLEYALNSELCSKQMNGNYIGTTRPRVNLDQIRYLKLFKPPLEEQQKIAFILSKVDDLINKIDQMIDKTQKLEKGLTQSLLTRGIGLSKFKRSETDIIRHEWDVGKLTDVTLNIMKGIFDLSPKNYVPNGIPFLRISDIERSNISLVSTKYIPEEVNRKFPSSELKPGDIILAKVGASAGSIDKIAEIPRYLDKCNISQNLIGMKINHGKINSTFLFHFLHRKEIMNKILSSSNTTTFKSIQLDVLRNISIPLPSKDEQKQIASIISNLGEFIKKQGRIRLDCEILKKGLMQQLLTGKIRVKV
jgi:type I restriction enzyme S subunit